MAIEILALDPAARILVCSGDPRCPVMLSYKEYGFCGTLRKPYTVQNLSAAVAGMLDSA
jgi:two-component system cell cycle sensor histidine kinase/response regulator CckA